MTFIPEVKIKISQLKKINNVWPRSGCITNKKDIISIVKKDNEYFKRVLENFWLLNTELTKIIRKGLTNSIGWNLGKKIKSIHLFDPFTSTPIKGTSINDIRDNQKIIKENRINFSLSIDEIIKMTKIPKRINMRCLKKKE